MLTRDQILTLHEAITRYRLDEQTARALAGRLRGRELRHLGWQGERGWFYRVRDVEAALRQTRQ